VSFDLLVYSFLSCISIILAIFYFIYPNRVLPVFFIFGLIVPTSNQFMSYTSFSGIYFFDYFFFLVTVYYLISLLINKYIFKKNILNIMFGLFILVFYSLLAINNSVVIDKYLFRDLRPFLTLGYAFVFVSSIKKPIISFRSLASSLIWVFLIKILFFILLLFGFSFEDQYYQNNIFRYFDAVTFIASLFLICYIFMRENMLKKISNYKLNLILILALIIVLISNLRILIIALGVIYLFFNKGYFFRKIMYLSFAVGSFLLYSYLMSANRVLDTNTSELVVLQIASRFAPAVERIIEMKPYEYIYGLGVGTTFEIPWFEYRSLDTKLNTIDSTYLSLFVKYGLLSIIIIIIMFRLLLFNSINKKNSRAIMVFYLIVFLTMSSLYQSGTVFHFLFLNLLFLSLKNESITRPLSITS
jgi:hypothetical protein